MAVFEATHGTASRYRGLHRANPMALMLCGAMLLRHIGETVAGDRLEAVAAVIAEGRTVTYDLRPTRDDPNAASTTEVRDTVVERLISRWSASARLTDLAGLGRAGGCRWAARGAGRRPT